MQKESGRTLGMADLADYEPLHQRAAVGIAIRKDCRRQGYGAQALQLLCGYAFRHLHLHQLYAWIPQDNEASLALFARCGFTEKAWVKDWLQTGGGSYKGVWLVQRIAPAPNFPTATPPRTSRNSPLNILKKFSNNCVKVHRTFLKTSLHNFKIIGRFCPKRWKVLHETLEGFSKTFGRASSAVAGNARQACRISSPQAGKNKSPAKSLRRGLFHFLLKTILWLRNKIMTN